MIRELEQQICPSDYMKMIWIVENQTCRRHTLICEVGRKIIKTDKEVIVLDYNGVYRCEIGISNLNFLCTHPESRMLI